MKTRLSQKLHLAALLAFLSAFSPTVLSIEERPDNYSDQEITEWTTKFNNMADFYSAKTRFVSALNDYSDEKNRDEVKPKKSSIPDMPTGLGSTSSLSLPSPSGMSSVAGDDIGLGIEQDVPIMYLKSVFGLNSDLQGEIVWGDSVIAVKKGTRLLYGYIVVVIENDAVLIRKPGSKEMLRISSTPTKAPMS